MPFNGSGTFVRVYDWTDDAAANIPITASRFDTEDDGFATGLSTCVTRDGQSPPSANLPMGGYKLTGMGVGSALTDSLTLGQAQAGAFLDAGATGGSSTVYTATLSPAIMAYADGQCFRVQFDQACGNNPTINFNTVGARKIYKNVAGTATQLVADDVPADFVALLRYDSTLDSATGGFWLLNWQDITSWQPKDATLTALAAYNTNGLMTQTAADTFTGRSVAGSGLASVTNGNGVSGNPTVTVTGATQSDQETGTSTTVAVTPAVQQYHPSAIKAWCVFDGTAGSPTVAAGYNVASITKNGTGDYTVTFTVAMSSTTYGVSGSAANAGRSLALITRSTGSVQVVTAAAANTPEDNANVTVMVFGDQ